MIQVFDNFVPDPEAIRQSAFASGFGTWKPNKGIVGLDEYSGVNFMGDHATLFNALYKKLGQIIPSSQFFRITNPSMERAIIHSDREYGCYTAIVYLSPNTIEQSGTGFYRHKETGWVDMPALRDLIRDPVRFATIKQQMMDANERDWECWKFVEAKYNRCVVFDAPKIHARLPMNGYGTDDKNSRMVWVCHFDLPEKDKTEC